MGDQSSLCLRQRCQEAASSCCQLSHAQAGNLVKLHVHCCAIKATAGHCTQRVRACRLQLQAFQRARELLLQHPEHATLDIRATFIGGCRNEGDTQRFQDLEAAAASLGLQDVVDFCVNAPVGTMREMLARSVGGLHSMQDEHFGISVVDYMAAGCIPIAHDSGAALALAVHCCLCNLLVFQQGWVKP